MNPVTIFSCLLICVLTSVKPTLSGHYSVSTHPGVNLPVYRDSGPRIRYIRRRVSRPSTSYHHQFYGYIPGIPGRPWKDYPIYSRVPQTSFSCKLVKYPGFYADVEAGCQVWHYCQLDGRQDKFLCPNGTMFNQKTRVCKLNKS